MGIMLKISIKFNILTCLVPCDRFLHGPGVAIPLPPRMLETIEDSISEKFWSDDDHQPKQFNQAELDDLARGLNLPKVSALILGSRKQSKAYAQH